MQLQIKKVIAFEIILAIFLVSGYKLKGTFQLEKDIEKFSYQ